MNVADAINVLAALTTLAANAAASANQVSQIIAQANAQGRDLSDEEKTAIRRARDLAISELDAAIEAKKQ